MKMKHETSKESTSENFRREKNAKDNQAVIFENRLKSNFVSKNVVNFTKRNINDAETSLLLKGLNSALTCNNIDKSKHKMELETFGITLCLKFNFHNENKDIHRDMFNPRNKDAAIELDLSSLREKVMKVEVPKDNFNSLTSSEWEALYDCQNDKSIVVKGADKVSAVVVWDKEDYMQETEK